MLQYLQSIFTFFWCHYMTDSCGMLDGNIALDLSSTEQPIHTTSNAHQDSLDSTSRSYGTQEASPGGQVLELLDERIGETSLSHCTEDVKNGCTSVKDDGGSCKECVNVSSEFMGGSSKNNYLQVGSIGTCMCNYYRFFERNTFL